MIVLGIETSCDETAAAVVTGERRILSNVVLSQTAEHSPYGGVVPEIAARSHIEHLTAVIAKALEEADKTFADLSAIAATGGPGLIGGIIVGVMTGKALASVHRLPFIAVNHLEGHALTVRLTHDVTFPYLLLLVSGGHCQFLAVDSVGSYRKLGGTVDDALGEAFDKTAKMLGMPYPGGPAVERLARAGDAARFAFTVPMKGRPGCDFSFSGLKTAVRHETLALRAENQLGEQEKADLCASFQRTAGDAVTDRTEHAIKMFRALHPQSGTLVIAGGVAANRYLRERLETLAMRHGMRLVAPPAALCTDNAAMIAWAGIERFRLGDTDGLDFEPKARWPLAKSQL